MPAYSDVMATMGPASQPNDTRQLLLGMLLGFLLMIGTMLATLWGIGALSAPTIAAPREHIVITSDQLDQIEAKPTAVWRFRDEWLTPRPK